MWARRIWAVPSTSPMVRDAQDAVVAARGEVRALGRAQRRLAPGGIWRGDPVEQLAGRSPPSSVGGGRAPDDIVDQNQPLMAL
jgi:hypothetical protein